MNILVFMGSFNLGGAEKHGTMLAEYFKNELHYNVQVWSLIEGNGRVRELCKDAGIETKVIGNLGRLGTYLYRLKINKYSKIIKQFKPDVILAFTHAPSIITGLLWKKVGAKSGIWSIQCLNDYDFSAKIHLKAFKSVSYYISNSRHAMNVLREKYLIEEDRAFVVRNGIADTSPKYDIDTWHKKIGVKKNQFKALMIGHIAKRKDHVTLLKAWKIVVEVLKKENVDPVLILAGSFYESSQPLLDLAFELEIFPNIKFLGNVREDIIGLNHAVDLSVLCSNTEGLPNSVLEAMLCSLPFVGTDIPGIREAVSEDNFKFLSLPKDHVALADNILLFARSKTLRMEIGNHNRKLILNNFDLKRMCEETHQIIIKNLTK